MTEYTFKVNLSGITDLECFKEASKDELKVLVALASLNGEAVTLEQLTEMTGVSRARSLAAIALFEESGALKKYTDGIYAEVEYEFEPAPAKEQTAKEVARSIRENDLYEMNIELENMLGKTLEARELERITSLHTKAGLSVEYILTLVAYLSERKKVLTVESIVREANNLVRKNIDTLEELELYIKEKADEVAGEMEIRRTLGIFGRNLTKSEREYFKRWLTEFCYSTVIISEAYDITIKATGQLSLPYMNSVLSGWHEAGCKTIEDCQAKTNARKYESAKKANNNSQNKKKSVEAETPKYTDFNSEDALLRALERSYGDAE